MTQSLKINKNEGNNIINTQPLLLDAIYLFFFKTSYKYYWQKNFFFFFARIIYVNMTGFFKWFSLNPHDNNLKLNSSLFVYITIISHF